MVSDTLNHVVNKVFEEIKFFFTSASNFVHFWKRQIVQTSDLKKFRCYFKTIVLAEEH